MSVFSRPFKSSGNGSVSMPKLLRRTSLKRWAGTVRRKLSTDKGRSANNIKASATEQIFEESNDDCVTTPNLDATDIEELQAETEQDEGNSADAPTFSSTISPSLVAPSTHDEHSPSEPLPVDETGADETESLLEDTPPKLKPGSLDALSHAYHEPPQHNRESVRLVPADLESVYEEVPLAEHFAAHMPPSHWLSSRLPYALDDPLISPTLRGCAPFKLSLV
ncbi:uncharacterized protein PHACADRAFT_207523 [Phanerochaete carnosa HHB-10118-sp]|uniref:Uncharacterized protein n=1 Tax=Phanerochaete carnosa (strain HHB-10118-sp) TaxID=650164 RepID=K5WAK0_PHACS|nr:uncharacterized protein PHACADRAFT_207523 [Phanerochaete carnosa HHB-10118-sp]EKM56240.1 hypothetical protein PHACADRAFT_207523 [Phanerochaete carnosa HHB-10118-sp]